MNTEQISKLVSCVGCRVLSLDQLPKQKCTGSTFIIYNVDRSNMPGKFYFFAFFLKKKCVYIFLFN